MKKREWVDFDELALMTRLVVRIAIHIVILSAWVIASVEINRRVIAPQHLEGMELWVASAFQLLFVISTFVPVGIHIGKDLWCMVLRAQATVRQTKRESIPSIAGEGKDE